MDTVAVVMAGGIGTRLYPASRPDRPKQFLSLGGDRSLLCRTLDRAAFADRIVIVTRAAFADRVTEHVPDGLDTPVDVLVEPVPRDTGPALVYAAHELRDEDAVLVCLPSDHVIAGPFDALVDRMTRAAVDTGGLVTAGIEPERPAPGYGYVKPGDPDPSGYTPVAGFYEKPDPGAAARYVHHGYYWNAGVFAWTPDALLGATRDSPLAGFLDGLAAGDPDAAFEAAEAISVDRAVLETTEDAYVVAAPDGLSWTDLGTWDALRSVVEPDPDGNVAVGETLAIDAEDTTLVGLDGTHVTAIGVEGLAVVAAGDRVLVVPERAADRVREAVDQLAAVGRFDRPG